MKLPPPDRCSFCRGQEHEKIFIYERPPAGEIQFSFSSSSAYYREVWRCCNCGHFVSIHNMDSADLYSDEYVSSTYEDEAGIQRTFQRIIALPPERSDNHWRVRRILEFTSQYFSDFIDGKQNPSLLDVGSGLGVFPYKMKQAGWNCTAIDPDPRSIVHIERETGVRGICGDFTKLTNIGRFDVITFNKVLEHVVDPVPMLSKSLNYLTPKGLIYVELPDGEMAIAEGSGREEFFIDHWHIFSSASFSLLAFQANLSLILLERVREPSSKYTLRGFLKPAHSS